MNKRHLSVPLACALLLRLAVPHALASDRSVTDAPYAAKADMKTVTDAVIPGGSKTLSSTSAAFTSADVGKSLVVAAAL